MLTVCVTPRQWSALLSFHCISRIGLIIKSVCWWTTSWILCRLTTSTFTKVMLKRMWLPVAFGGNLKCLCPQICQWSSLYYSCEKIARLSNIAKRREIRFSDSQIGLAPWCLTFDDLVQSLIHVTGFCTKYLEIVRDDFWLKGRQIEGHPGWYRGHPFGFDWHHVLRRTVDDLNICYPRITLPDQILTRWMNSVGQIHIS